MSDIEVGVVFSILMLSNMILCALGYDCDSGTGSLIAVISAAVETGFIAGAFWIIEHIRFV